MHRILPNILFLLILFMLATAFPLSTDILSLNLSTKIVEKPVDEIVIEAKLDPVLPTANDSITKESISFEIKSTTGTFPSNMLTEYEVLVVRHDAIVDRLFLSELAPITTDAADSKKEVAILKSSLLDSMPSGYYTFKLVHKGEALDYTWYGANLTDDKVLLATSNTLGATQLGFTLYYPTLDYGNVVPITRIVTLPDNRWRALYTALTNGPKNGLGLTDKVPAVPFAPNIRISQNIANIYMYSANLSGYENQYETVVDAVTKTFMTLGPLEGVKFYVNDSSNAFSGVDLSKTYTQTTQASAFIGYSLESSYMMLLPVGLKSTDFNERIEEIWQTLKLNSEEAQQIDGVIQTIPDEVFMESYSLEGRTLTLDLNVSPGMLFNTNTDYEKLMLNSILYSYASLPEVEAIIIKVLGQFYSNDRYDFSLGIVPDRFYNMEP